MREGATGDADFGVACWAFGVPCLAVRGEGEDL